MFSKHIFCDQFCIKILRLFLPLMKTTTKYVWNMFEQYHPINRRRDVEVVHMIIDTNGDAEAITDGGVCTINVRTVYLKDYAGNMMGSLKA